MEIQPRSHHQYHFPNFFGTYFAPAAQAGDWGLKSRETNVSRSPGRFCKRLVFFIVWILDPQFCWTLHVWNHLHSPWPTVLPFWSPESIQNTPELEVLAPIFLTAATSRVDHGISPMCAVDPRSCQANSQDSWHVFLKLWHQRNPQKITKVFILVCKIINSTC
jgi:hypothetical protein